MRHRFHSLCPYFAMFPESFAETWIGRLTEPGDVVLDLFSGRGTTAFQALLMGRRAVATDVNDVAYCLTKAKTQAPRKVAVLRRLRELESQFDARSWRHQADACSEFFQVAFARRTLQQLLFLRSTLNWKSNAVDSMVAALAMGSLHGECDKSSAYFSNQMPRTISTKPGYSVRYWRERQMLPPVRDVFAMLRQRTEFRYESNRPTQRALVFHSDMRDLPSLKAKLPSQIACCITSPPYFDVTSFEEDQWLRLWLLGGPEYPTRGRVSRDDRHSLEDSYWEFIADMWRSLGSLIAENGDVVIRIGSRSHSPDQLVSRLLATSVSSSRAVQLLNQEVSEIKKRQTDSFRPGSRGCSVEVDCHFRFST